MCLVTFLSGSRAKGKKGVHTLSCAKSLKFVSSCPALACLALGKGQLFVSQWFQVKLVGRKLKMLVWRILATDWKKLEYRTQSNLQVENNLQIQVAVLESDIYEGILLKCNFFLGIIFFHQRLQ